MTTAAYAARRTTSRRAVWRWLAAAAAARRSPSWSGALGTGPFLDGLRTVDGGALAAAAGLAVLTTVCCAWRWRIVARGLGVDLPLGTAVAAYYRSLFLNVTLPGGVVGDVHRGISHGRDTSDVGRGLRAVAWERSAGQVVQVVLTVAVLLVAAVARAGGHAARRARARSRRRPASRVASARAAGRAVAAAQRRGPRPARRLLARRAWPADRARVGAGRRGPRASRS